MSATELYPLSTQDGKHIPLDVVKPKGLVAFAVAATAGPITIPTGYGLVWVYSTVLCALRFSVVATPLPNALVAGTSYPDTILIPADTLMTVVAVPGLASVLGLSGAGVLYMNSIEQWAALVQGQQSTTG